MKSLSVTSTPSKALPSSFLLRRLHSLTGILPLGFYLLQHAWMNLAVLQGVQAYDARLAALHRAPFWLVFDFLFILLPLAFHVFFGLAIVYQGKNNVMAHPRQANWRYFLQRVTALLTLVFLAFHVYEARFAPLAGGQTVNFDFLRELLGNPARLALYLVGGVAASFHFCNGVWSFLISWGVLVSLTSQKRVLRICLAAFVILAAAHIAIVLHLAPLDGMRLIRDFFGGRI